MPTARALLDEDRRLKSQGNLHDSPGFERLLHAVNTPLVGAVGVDECQARADATLARYRDLDAPGLIGRSLDLHG